jgi:hypothetical protein
MSDFAPRVALATLHKRTSQNGRTYWTGFMGKARVLLFEDAEAERPEWSEGVFTLYVQEQPDKAAGKPPQRKEPYAMRKIDPEALAAYEARKAASAPTPARKSKPKPVARPFDDDLPWSA